MVAVADEGTYAVTAESCETIDEAQLGPQAPVGPVVDVAGDQQGIHLFTETEM